MLGEGVLPPESATQAESSPQAPNNDVMEANFSLAATEIQASRFDPYNMDYPFRTDRLCPLA